MAANRTWGLEGTLTGGRFFQAVRVQGGVVLQARRLATLELNAAVEGGLAGGSRQGARRIDETTIELEC